MVDTSLFICLLYAFLLLIIRLRDKTPTTRHTWALAGLGGLALGLTMLTRPVVAPLAILLVPWFLLRLNLQQTILRLLPVALVAGLLLLPWALRNFRHFDSFPLLTTNSGSSLWLGNNAGTVPTIHAGYDVQWITGPQLPEGLNEREHTTRPCQRWRWTGCAQTRRSCRNCGG